MKSIFTAVATVLALTLAASVPALAATFPALTTIYYAVGVFDGGGAANSGTATTVSCSNLSGQSARS